MWRCCDASQVGTNSRNSWSGHLTHLEVGEAGEGVFPNREQDGASWGQTSLQMGTLPTTSHFVNSHYQTVTACHWAEPATSCHA